MRWVFAGHQFFIERESAPDRYRITRTFLALVGSHSSEPSYEEYMYGVSAWNSAAHVSTRWNDAMTPSSFRRARTSSGFDPAGKRHKS